jgi:glutamate N-acetyltransferase/amino-acid N-acetyltransferase
MSTSWKNVRGGVAAPGGFAAAGTACGIKSGGKNDLALLLSDRPAEWSALLTKNRAPAAPVLLTRALLRRRRPLQAVLVNSGNANSATGDPGMKTARSVVAAAAALLDLPESAVIMASTGIIGVQLPGEKIRRSLPRLAKGLSNGGSGAAEAIMTTDSVLKETALELRLGGGERVRIGGMAKGSGMINPDMATMLAFVTTDAGVSRSLMARLLRRSGDETFNRITVDGDCSTNDTVLAMANGASRVSVTAGSSREKLFAEGLTEVCRRLAVMIVRDGEGATKFVEVRVTGARSKADALKAARAVANSALVKTAWFGQDLNWGRILAALGYSGARIDVGRISIDLNGQAVVREGAAAPREEYSRARKQMRRKDLLFLIDLGIGRGEESVLTCDLSLDYVRENALYTT